VFLEESQLGKLRVVKKVATKDQLNWRSELDAMGRVCQSTEYGCLAAACLKRPDINLYSNLNSKQLFVDFIGWFPSRDRVCLVMEYCPYGDLSKCYPKAVSEIDAWCICAQLLEGLAVLHNLGIVHRDIKPQASASPSIASTNVSQPLTTQPECSSGREETDPGKNRRLWTQQACRRREN
jgi:serine/threonine protein kinase